MMVFGTRGVKSNIKTGDFNCPQCNNNQPYRHRKVTQYFTFYFIPLVPLGKKGEFVECKTCKGTFYPGVLEHDNIVSDESKALYETAIKHSMVLIMLADGVIEEEEKKEVLKVINKYSKTEVTEEDLDAYIKQVQKGDNDISTYLKEMSSVLNEYGKEMIIKCAFAVSAADGNIDKSELKLISKMADALEMSSNHFRGIVTEMKEGNSANAA